MYRLLKIGRGFAYLGLVVLTWKFAHHHVFDDNLSLGCATISGLWLAITLLEMRNYLHSYFDSVARLALVLPTILGCLLAVLLLIGNHGLALRAVSVVLIGGWSFVFYQYESHKREYLRTGKQRWLPKDTWTNPPAEAFEPGDTLLTFGRFAKLAGDPLGHGEKAIIDPNKIMRSLTSLMDKGVIIRLLSFVATMRETAGSYVVMRLKTPLTEEQQRVGWEIAQIMLAENERWRKEEQARWDRIFNDLSHFLPQTIVERLRKKVHVTGYDWLGLVFGRQVRSHWTCIACCEEWDRRMGLPTEEQASAFLWGFLDPIMPVRSLKDRAYRILTLEDKRLFEAKMAKQKAGN